MSCATTAYIWHMYSLCCTYISIYTYIQIKQKMFLYRWPGQILQDPESESVK